VLGSFDYVNIEMLLNILLKNTISMSEHVKSGFFHCFNFLFVSEDKVSILLIFFVFPSNPLTVFIQFLAVTLNLFVCILLVVTSCCYLTHQLMTPSKRAEICSLRENTQLLNIRCTTECPASSFVDFPSLY
jgi:hypothetical protein